MSEQLPPVPYQAQMTTQQGTPSNTWAAFFRSLIDAIKANAITTPIDISAGGTGQTTQQGAVNALTGTQSAGKYLRSDGVNASLSAITPADVPTLNQSTTGTASNVTGIVAPANGGTGVANTNKITTGSNDITLTSTGTTNVTLPTSGTIATLANSETFSSKSFSDAVTLAEISTPSSPASGKLKVYPKSDNNLYTLNSSGQETQVGSGAGSSGTKNYLGTVNGVNGNGNAELGTTTKWSLAHSALTNKFPLNVGLAGFPFSAAGGSNGGSAANGNLSLSTVNSGQLAGSYSFSYASSSATTAGDMLISDAFTIDIEDQAKVLTIKAYYTSHSGASNCNFSGTSSNSFGIAIYDVTNGAWIMPAGVWNLVQSSGVGIITGTFQTTSNSTQYQIALFNANATSGAATLYLDDFFVGPQTAPVGPAMNDFKDNSSNYTFGGFGSVSNVKIFERRVGDTLEVQGYFQVGTTAASTAFIQLPYAIDTSKYGAASNNQMVGIATNAAGGSGSGPFIQGEGWVLFYDGSTNNQIFWGNAGVTSTSAYAKLNGNGVTGNNYQYSIKFSVPIAGWSSNTVMSSDTDTRVCAARSRCVSTSTTISSNVDTWIDFETKDYDTHGAVTSGGGFKTSSNAGAWKYTAQVSGFYRISAGLAASSGSPTSMDLKFLKNGTEDTRIREQGIAGSASPGISGSVQLKLNAGDYLEVVASFNANTTVNSSVTAFVNVERFCGPAVVAATEAVAVYGSPQTPSGTISGSASVAKFAATNDTHGGYSASTGLYTVQVSGWYQCNAMIQVSHSTSSSNNQAYIYKNGSAAINGPFIFASGSSQSSAPVNGIVYCNAGDTLGVYVLSNNTSPTYTASQSTFSFARTGRGN
jgi:hypothetical protein